MSSQEFGRELPGFGEEVKQANLDPVEEILWALGEMFSEPPAKAFAAADAYREALTPRLLAVLASGNSDPMGDGPAMLYPHAMFLLAKWREKDAMPLVLECLALPAHALFALGGEGLLRAGARILASVSKGRMTGTQMLLENEDASTPGRSLALEALATMVVWREMEKDTLAAYLRNFAERKLKYASSVWSSLAVVSIDLGLRDLQPTVLKAFDQEWINPAMMTRMEFVQGMMGAGQRNAAEKLEAYARIEDVAAESAGWSCYRQPVASAPKVGRNEQCPCGSGKKYKKCCGKGG